MPHVGRQLRQHVQLLFARALHEIEAGMTHVVGNALAVAIRSTALPNEQTNK
jgi:hypothetical protein